MTSCVVPDINCCYVSFDPYIRPNRCQNCNYNLASNSPASLYQKQKIIQNTVRVASSLYTMNLGSLKVYQSPEKEYGVNWKQMSDRKIPHIQKVVVPTQKSTKRSYTLLRPGSGSPGGVGVDMKHNSYDRYLARIKGKAPLRRDIVPPLFPVIPFNRAFPIYGGKTFKTNIVNGYNCPECADEDNNIYKRETNVFDPQCFYSVGNVVYVINESGSCDIATIEEVLGNNQFAVIFSNGTRRNISCSQIVNRNSICGNVDGMISNCDAYNNSCVTCNDGTIQINCTN